MGDERRQLPSEFLENSEVVRALRERAERSANAMKNVLPLAREQAEKGALEVGGWTYRILSA